MHVSTVSILFFCASALLLESHVLAKEMDDRYMHPSMAKRSKLQNRIATVKLAEKSGDYWNAKAQSTIQDKLEQQELNKNVAKNVILFLGDGMSIPTLAATRVYVGGEEEELSFEKFHHTALSKTYCVDYQVADSACSATAYLCGIKANMATIGVTGDVLENDCAGMANTTNHVQSIAKWSQLKGKSTGLVTNTRVTHASPAGVYANTASRNWESDSGVIEAGHDATVCRDIAYQLIKNDVGRNLNVILGGGRREFVPVNYTDEDGEEGRRSDNANLIEEWLEQKTGEGLAAKYVWNRTDLLEAADQYNHVLGLFSSSHMPYNLERDNETVPSLAEMTEAAIKILSRASDNGYFLFVEGGRIDHAHHETWAKKSFDETAEFSKAIQAAVDLTSDDDTLIVVTSDHAHTMSISGYPERYNHILKDAGTGSDSVPYMTINYANGPGYKADNDDGRYDCTLDDTTHTEYMFPGVAPLDSETHGGDDVAIFARGPWAHLFSGVMEQNTIPHIMAYASCVNDGISACSGASSIQLPFGIIVLAVNLLFYLMFAK